MSMKNIPKPRIIITAAGAIAAFTVAVLDPAVRWYIIPVMVVVPVVLIGLSRAAKTGVKDPGPVADAARAILAAISIGLSWIVNVFRSLMNLADKRDTGKGNGQAGRPRRGAPDRSPSRYGGGTGGGRGGGDGAPVPSSLQPVPADTPAAFQQAADWIRGFDIENDIDFRGWCKGLAAGLLTLANATGEKTEDLAVEHGLAPESLIAAVDLGEDMAEMGQNGVRVYMTLIAYFAAVKEWLAENPDRKLPKRGGEDGFLTGEGEAA